MTCSPTETTEVHTRELCPGCDVDFEDLDDDEVVEWYESEFSEGTELSRTHEKMCVWCAGDYFQRRRENLTGRPPLSEGYTPDPKFSTQYRALRALGVVGGAYSFVMMVLSALGVALPEGIHMSTVIGAVFFAVFGAYRAGWFDNQLQSVKQ